ncbi:MAG: S8 family peptidase [Bacteroidales bacterium]|nr:S8 family peptidase [Bacteroidales bacterium]
MPEKKPHLFFRNPVEGVEKYTQPRRNPGIQDDEEEKNYDPMKDVFLRCRDSFFADKEIRIRKRNAKLNVPVYLEYIELHFFDSFNSDKYENLYRSKFGLAPVVFKEYNSVGKFAIADNSLFQNFITQLELFINTEDHTINRPYDNLITFIKEFYFLSTERIIEFSELQSYVLMNLITNPELFQSFTMPIEGKLRDYLEQNHINFVFDSNNERIELLNIQQTQLIEILDNFDIIHSVNSYTAGVIRPSPYNTPIREYGFSISNANEELPIIGIIDTGISSNTPLAAIVINQDNEFDITGTSPLLDEFSHGTAVATLAALGNRLYPDHLGSFETDAKLLSIKVLNKSRGTLKISDIEKLIRKAYTKYACKIFTLTITFEQPLKDNSNISEYAYILDKLADELNILIFISAGNNYELTENAIPIRTISYPTHFADEKRNICSPADSYNNLVIGAIADNFENNGSQVLATDSCFPASYTRKHNLSVHPVLKNSKRKSKHLTKPDIALPGGDFDSVISYEYTGLKIISTNTGIFFDRQAGTSLSAPLAANLAAKLIRTYPSLADNMQSIKALIINSADEPNYSNVFKSARIESKKLIGKGIPDEYRCIFSDENSLTFLLEDTIEPNNIKVYPLNLPEYLNDLQHKKGVIEVSATLCYKIQPIQETHISYCPVCISFGFFKNLPLNGNGATKKLNNSESEAIKLKQGLSWSDDYYYGIKLLSNTQKVIFRLDKRTISRENYTIKIAVNCKLHKLLNQIQKRSLSYEMPFSIAINIHEIPLKGELSGNLYTELEAINTLEAISSLEATLENNI